jgi:hypothetical protein
VNRVGVQGRLQKDFYRQALVFCCAVLAVMLLRSYWTFPVTDHDAIQKYYFAAEIVRSGDWSLLLHSHHTMRWVEMLPQVGLVAIVGPRYELFYLLPLLGFALYFVLLLWCLRSFLPWPMLVLLATLLFVDPLSFRLSSQLLNPPFGVLFVALASLLLARAGSMFRWTLPLAALALFCACGAHVTYLGFAAGLCLWLGLARSNWLAAVQLGAWLAVLLVAETLVFNALSGGELVLGRLQALSQSSHMELMAGQGNDSGLSDLLSRWLRMPPFHLVLSGLFLLASLAWVSNSSLRREAPGFISAVWAASVAYAVALTFAVSDLDPLTPAMPLRPRYLSVFYPFATVFTVYLLAQAPRTIHSLAPVLSGLLLGVLLLQPRWFSLPADSLVIIRPFAFAWRAGEQYNAFADGFARGELVIGGRFPGSLLLIAQYARPGEVRWQERTVFSTPRQSGALCVDRLARAPLAQNFLPCPATPRVAP